LAKLPYSPIVVTSTPNRTTIEHQEDTMSEAMNPKTVHKPLGMYSHMVSVPMG
jgi:hypothetical protein